MHLIEWKEEFSLGIPAIDYEHRELINLINEILAKLGERAAHGEYSDYLGEIYARIASHFILEEKIMREKNYDQYQDHKADHERLMDDIRNIMDIYEDNAEIDIEDFASRLSRWFTDHFRVKDARLHKYLVSK